MTRNLTTSAAEALVQCLLQEGVDTVFGIPGGLLCHLLDAMGRAGIRSIEARHEGAAAYMAAAYTQACGKLGVVYGQVGPGVLNTLTGVASAYVDSTPMLVLAGQVPRRDIGGHGHQEATGFARTPDQIAMFRETAHFAARPPDPANVPRFARRAIAVAMQKRGPAMLDLPADLLGENITYDDLARSEYRSSSTPVDPRDVQRIAELLAHAERPVMLVGDRMSHRGATAELIAFCEEQQIACAAVSQAKGVVPEDHPLYLGAFGRSGQGSSLEAFRSADLVLVLGARLATFTSFGSPDFFRNMVQVDTIEEEIGRAFPIRYGAVADPLAMLRALRGSIGSAPPTRNQRALVEELRARHGTYKPVPPRGDDVQLNAPEALSLLRAKLPRNAIIVGDTGNTALYTGRYFPVYEPDGYYALYGFASMGSGLPMAYGVQLARPEALVVSIMGDGAFLAHPAELGLGAQHGLPVLHVVVNNGRYGSIADRQKDQYGRYFGSLIPGFDCVKVAEGFGCAGWSVTTAAQLASAVDAALKLRRSAVIEVKVDPTYVEPPIPELTRIERAFVAKATAGWSLPPPFSDPT